MSLTRKQAFVMLGLPSEASDAEIKAAYKKLALEWHPDKNNNSETATSKFQQVTAAYRLLTTETKAQRHMTLDDMLDFFHVMFFGAPNVFTFYPPPFDSSSDDESMGCRYNMFTGLSTSDVYHYSTRVNGSASTTAEKHKTTYNTVSVEEANKNAADLMEEEENSKKKVERRKSKKKRQKERRQQAKVEKKQNKKPEDYTEGALSANSSEDEIEVPAESKALNEDPVIKPGTLTMNPTRSARGDVLKERPVTKQNHEDNTIPPVFSGTKDHAGTASYLKTNDIRNFNRCNGHAKHVNVKEASQRERVSSYTLPASETFGDNSCDNGAEKASSDSEDEPEWDKDSAFFAKVANSKKQQPKPTKVDRIFKSKKKPVPVKEEKPENVTGVVQTASPDELAQRSVAFAVQGNQLASTHNYAEAIEKFTEAIKLFPQDYRFFGNRSYCFERLGMYNDALMDADIAVNINSTWPRGYFRKARAFIGLKRYTEAESMLCHVIALETSSEDGKQELMNVRILRLMDMGFSQQQAKAAIWENHTVENALEALLRKTGAVPKSGVSNGIQNIQRPTVQKKDSKSAVGNSAAPQPALLNLVSLWVGNLTPAITEDMLQRLFIPFGRIHSIKMLLPRRCAFVNYSGMKAAEGALNALQGYQILNTSLIIRFQSTSTMGTGTFQQPPAMPPGPHNEHSKVQSKGGFH